MNIDDRLRAASRALKDSSVAQVGAASRLREIVQGAGQPVAHGHTAALSRSRVQRRCNTHQPLDQRGGQEHIP